MNYYPEALKAILAYIEALNAAEKSMADSDGQPYVYEAALRDSDGVEYGHLRDEIGGSWSWFPPEVRS